MTEKLEIEHQEWCPVAAHGECCGKAGDPGFWCDCGAHRLQLKVDKLAWNLRMSQAEVRRLRERRQWHSQRRQEAEMAAAELRRENRRLEGRLAAMSKGAELAQTAEHQTRWLA